MAKDSIREKLRLQASSFSELSLDERDVVYLLIEVGKFLEREGIQKEFSPLYFFRNWVAHTRKNSATSVPPKLKEVIEKSTSIEEIKDVFIETLEDLRISISSFFETYLGQKIFESKGIWETFQTCLLLILSEQALCFENSRNRSIEVVGHSSSFKLIITDDKEYNVIDF